MPPCISPPSLLRAVFNLADKGDTDQGKLAGVLGRLFGIPTGFYGSVMSNLARLKMDTVVNEANEQHLAPWLGLLKQHGIKNTPLSPFLHKQLLQHHHLFVDGSAIEAAGFKYAMPELTDEGLREVVQQHIVQGIFPVSVVTRVQPQIMGSYHSCKLSMPIAALTEAV